MCHWLKTRNFFAILTPPYQFSNFLDWLKVILTPYPKRLCVFEIKASHRNCQTIFITNDDMIEHCNLSNSTQENLKIIVISLKITKSPKTDYYKESYICIIDSTDEKKLILQSL